MRYTLTLVFFVASSVCLHAQNNRYSLAHNISNENPKLIRTVSGSIHLPSLFQISIIGGSNLDFVFDNWEAYKNGITKRAGLHTKIKSTRPWILMVACGNGNFQSASGLNMPSSLLKIKPSLSTRAFIPVTQYPQIILENSSSTIISDHDFDVKMDAPLEYRGGDYSANLVFSITAP